MFNHNGGTISASSQRDVLYSCGRCGRCGYALNLSSSERNTAGIGAEYGKAIKKGVVSFVAIDESRFTQADELRCLPYFRSPRSWGLRRRRTRLLCRACGSLVGFFSPSSAFRNYSIRIGALQPSADDSATPLFP